MEGVLVALAVLACPVGMVVMMWFMGKGMKGGEPRGERERPASLDELRSEHDRLGADIERLEDAERSRDGEPAAR